MGSAATHGTRLVFFFFHEHTPYSSPACNGIEKVPEAVTGVQCVLSIAIWSHSIKHYGYKHRCLRYVYFRGRFAYRFKPYLLLQATHIVFFFTPYKALPLLVPNVFFKVCHEAT